MSKVNRGEKILNRLVSENKITSTGRDWLVAALDPFHDSQLDNLEGWPDTECGASVVRCIKQSITIAVPTSMAAANWDCHVVVWPFLNSNGATFSPNLRNTNIITGPVFPVSSAVAIAGGVTISGMKSGSSWQMIDNPGFCERIASIDLDNSYTQGAGRLLGMGVEVHNTTADLYKQGSVAVYRQQAENRDPCTLGIYNTGLTPYSSSFSAQLVRLPPTTLSGVMLLSGSRQWEARDGAYSVMAFSGEENPAIPPAYSVPVVQAAQQDPLENNLDVWSVNCPAPKAILGGQAVMLPQRVHPIHQSGIFFTGLSPQSTLTINVNYFYESFPGPAEPQILVLAKPSAKYDPCVMELYSRLVQELPVGVPVSENGLGDWFLDAATKAAKYLGPVLGALPHPIAKGAGAALTYLGDTGQDYVKRQQNQLVQPPNSWENSGGGYQEYTHIAKEQKKLKKKVKKVQKELNPPRKPKKKANR